MASNCSSMKINTVFPSLVASLNMLPSIQGPEGMANKGKTVVSVQQGECYRPAQPQP